MNELKLKLNRNICSCLCYFIVGEEPVPVVDFGAAGPIRCRRCGAYINPFCTFTDNGRSFICRVCEVSNEGKKQTKRKTKKKKKYIIKKKHMNDIEKKDSINCFSKNKITLLSFKQNFFHCDFFSARKLFLTFGRVRKTCGRPPPSRT